MISTHCCTHPSLHLRPSVFSPHFHTKRRAKIAVPQLDPSQRSYSPAAGVDRVRHLNARGCRPRAIVRARCRPGPVMHSRHTTDKRQIRTQIKIQTSLRSSYKYKHHDMSCARKMNLNLQRYLLCPRRNAHVFRDGCFTEHELAMQHGGYRCLPAVCIKLPRVHVETDRWVGRAVRIYYVRVGRKNRGTSQPAEARLLLILQHDTHHLTWYCPLEAGRFLFLPLNLAEILRRCHNGRREPCCLSMISQLVVFRSSKYQEGLLIVAKTSPRPLHGNQLTETDGYLTIRATTTCLELGLQYAQACPRSDT